MKIRAVDFQAHHLLLDALHRECFGAEIPKAYAAEPYAGHWWLVFDEGKPIAFAGMRPSLQWDKTGYMCRSGVTEHARGRGLQKRLIRVRMRKARALGWRWIITDTTENPASANSLIACGFRMYEPRAPWAYKNSCYWRRDLLDGEP